MHFKWGKMQEVKFVKLIIMGIYNDGTNYLEGF